MLSALRQFLFRFSLDLMVIIYDSDKNYFNLKYFPSFSFILFSFYSAA